MSEPLLQPKISRESHECGSFIDVFAKLPEDLKFELYKAFSETDRVQVLRRVPELEQKYGLKKNGSFIIFLKPGQRLLPEMKLRIWSNPYQIHFINVPECIEEAIENHYSKKAPKLKRYQMALERVKSELREVSESLTQSLERDQREPMSHRVHLEFAFDTSSGDIHKSTLLYPLIFEDLQKFPHYLNLHKTTRDLTKFTKSQNKTLNLFDGVVNLANLTSNLDKREGLTNPNIYLSFVTPWLKLKSGAVYRSSHLFGNCSFSSRVSMQRSGSTLRGINIIMPTGKKHTRDLYFTRLDMEKKDIKPTVSSNPYLKDLHACILDFSRRSFEEYRSEDLFRYFSFYLEKLRPESMVEFHKQFYLDLPTYFPDILADVPVFDSNDHTNFDRINGQMIFDIFNSNKYVHVKARTQIPTQPAGQSGVQHVEMDLINTNLAAQELEKILYRYAFCEYITNYQNLPRLGPSNSEIITPSLVEINVFGTHHLQTLAYSKAYLDINVQYDVDATRNIATYFRRSKIWKDRLDEYREYYAEINKAFVP
ncbi:hypothetical protein WICPIJ_001714 [Wickerhamomyces pijperi]|uniref:Uncharacterized protein n=1 Tax=Wickerhamomyces pijperi TaxID=599730 RepID=A0A9P8TQV5_WICPI|nr:hypothetical protein WICPIJ_001714 [Wickerhamomyces pijperi]